MGIGRRKYDDVAISFVETRLLPPFVPAFADRQVFTNVKIPKFISVCEAVMFEKGKGKAKIIKLNSS